MDTNVVITPTLNLKAYCFEVPYSQDMPVFTDGQGCTVRDTKGKQYLDALSGVFVLSFGYSHRPIIDTICEQYGRLPFSPPLHGVNDIAVALADDIVDFADHQYSCVKLVNGGSESIELAIRLSRVFHMRRKEESRYKTLSFYNSYHGSTHGSMSLTGRPDTWIYGARVPGALHVWPPDPAIFPECTDADVLADRCLEMIEHTVLIEGPESIAAFVMEPIIHLAGMLILGERFLAGVREICSRYGIILIFDEVVTGFGRTGAAFASDRYCVRPDLLCFGKGVSAGYAPLAGVLISSPLADCLRDERGLTSIAPSHTYASNPISTAAGMATLRLLREEGFLETLLKRGEQMRDLFRAALPDEIEIRSAGFLLSLKLPFAAGKDVEIAALESGVIVRGQSDWVVVAPPFIITDAEMADMIDVVSAAVRDTMGA